MKFTCLKANILEGINIVQKAVSSKSTLVILEGILIIAENHSIRLVSNNMELSIDYTFDATIELEGSVVINSRIFGDIIRKLSDDKVAIETTEHNMIYITNGNAFFEIMCLDSHEFPQAASISMDNFLEITEGCLKSMISKTIFSTSIVDLKPILTGVLFDLNAGFLNMVAIDGYRLARRTTKTGNTNISEKFVIPSKTLNELLKVLSDTENVVTIFVDKKHVLFKFEHFTMTSRLLEGEYLNYEAILPKEHAIDVVVSTREFIGSIERAALIINSEGTKTPIRLSFSEDSIHLNCIAQMGKVSDRVNAKIIGEDIEIGFNYKYLIDALKACDGDEVRVELNMSLNPCVIRPLNGDEYLYMILPIRLA